jgi:hypothetical protein
MKRKKGKTKVDELEKSVIEELEKVIRKTVIAQTPAANVSHFKIHVSYVPGFEYLREHENFEKTNTVRINQVRYTYKLENESTFCIIVPTDETAEIGFEFSGVGNCLVVPDSLKALYLRALEQVTKRDRLKKILT